LGQGQSEVRNARQIDAAGNDEPHEAEHPFFSTRAECRDYGLVGQTGSESIEGNSHMARIDANAGKHAARPDHLQGVFERSLPT
jgi:hypothetical protein